MAAEQPGNAPCIELVIPDPIVWTEAGFATAKFCETPADVIPLWKSQVKVLATFTSAGSSITVLPPSQTSMFSICGAVGVALTVIVLMAGAVQFVP
jgi:hypothetical protein